MPTGIILLAMLAQSGVCVCVCMCMPMYEQVCAIANRFECTHAHVENAT